MNHIWQKATIREKSIIIDYFVRASINEHPVFDLPQTPQKTIEELFAKGTILIAKDENIHDKNHVGGLLGYFRGTPSIVEQEIFCQTPKIAHVYVYVIDKEFRGRLSFETVPALIKNAINDRCEVIHFRALKEDFLLNKFYSRYAECIGSEINIQNKEVNKYTLDPKQYINNLTL